MSRVHINCPECRGVFSVKAFRAGHRVQCKLCGSVVRVPKGDAAPSEAADEAVDAPTPQPLLRRRMPDADDFAHSPLRRRDQKRPAAQTKQQLAIGGGIAVILLVLIGAFLAGRNSAPAVATLPPASPQPTTAPAPASLPATSLPIVMTQSAPPSVAPALSSEPAMPVAEPPPVASAESAPPETPAVAAAPLVKLDLPELIALVEPAVVRINVIQVQGAGHGSGFVVDQAGTIVTNHHVLEGAVRAQVEFADGTTADVKGFRYLSVLKDIAIIDVDLPAEKLHAVKVASQLPAKGTRVAAFGAPLGLSFTATDGIVSAIRSAEDVQESFGKRSEGHWIQTSAPISSGNSGGPLVDPYGQVIGMNTFVSVEGQNLNFSISCVDILAAITAAPARIQPLKEGAIAPAPTNRAITRQAAVDEIDTDRGRKLFANVREVCVLNAQKTSSFDPTGAVWNAVIRRSELSVERSGMKLSFGEPAADAALLIILLEMKPARTGSAGTQELSIKAELICVDPFAKGANKVARVWHKEETLGTISLDAAVAGRVPRSSDDNLGKFFTSFRSAYRRSVNEQKSSENPRGDSPPSAGSDK